MTQRQKEQLESVEWFMAKNFHHQYSVEFSKIKTQVKRLRETPGAQSRLYAYLEVGTEVNRITSYVELGPRGAVKHIKRDRWPEEIRAGARGMEVVNG